jgi:L-rhamnose mutarotase
MERSEAVGQVRRFGRVVGIREDKIAEYRRLHADSHPGVRDLLEKANMSNFSIFVDKLPDGNHYLFLYFEYTGDDYEADMAALAAEPRNKQWLSVCGPMQVPLPGEISWAEMEPVYYNP